MVLPNKLPLLVSLPNGPPAVVERPKSEELVVAEVDGALEGGF